MITQDEFDTLIELNEHRDELKSLIDSFDNETITASIGIVAIYDCSKHSPSKHDAADFFNNRLTKQKDLLNEVAIAALRQELHDVNLKINKYIKV